MGRLIILQDSSFIASNVSHLGNLRSKNPKNIIFSYININSIRNNFENFCDMVRHNVDVPQLQKQNVTLRFRMHSSYYLPFKSL